MRKNIILFGMRGAGKTTISKYLGESIGGKVFDLDEEIEKEAKMNISKMFETKGEKFFRDLEYKTLKKILFLPGKKIIALGGGTIVFERNQNLLMENKDDNKLIFIDTPLEIIKQRIINDEKTKTQRPSLTGKNVLIELEEVYNNRLPIYKKFAEFSVDGSKNIYRIVNEIKRALNYDKICVPVTRFDDAYIEKLYKKIRNISEITYVELRIDYLKDKSKLESLIKTCPKKVIVTNRMLNEGGGFKGSFKESLSIQQNAQKFGAYLVDLEVNFVNNEDLKYFDKEKLILSYHNFKEVPDLFFIAEKITRLSPYVCKMACMANSYSDVNLMKTALRIFLKKYLTQQRIIIPMGKIGMLSRIDFCWEGQFLTFAVLDNASAPGQMDYKQAYNYLTS